MILFGLLVYAVLAMWVQERWAWTLFQLGVFVLAGFRIVSGERWKEPGAGAVLAAAAAWPLLQLAARTTLAPEQTFYQALDWLTFLLVFVLGCEMRVERFLRAASLFGLLVATVAVLQQTSSAGKIFWLFPSGYSDDVLGPFVNRNQYAAWVELLLPVSLYLSITDARRRWLYAASGAALFGSSIAAGSRAGICLAGLEVVVTLGLLARSRPPRMKMVVLAGALAAVGIAVAVNAGIHRNGSEELRVDALKASFQMIRAHPWTGTGLGSWPMVYPRFAGLDRGLFVNQAHNDWAQWAAEGGIPFAALMAVFVGLLCKRAWRSIYGIGTVVFLIHALVDYPMQQRPALAAWFFAAAGVAFHGARRRSAGKNIPRFGRATVVTTKDYSVIRSSLR